MGREAPAGGERSGRKGEREVPRPICDEGGSARRERAGADVWKPGPLAARSSAGRRRPMHRIAVCLLPVLALSPAAAATLEGNWETVISSPRRPWIFQTRFEHQGDAWKGVMSVHGYG